MPFLAPSPVPVMTAVGVARPSAHGQAITSTEVKIRSAKERLSPAISQTAAAISATDITTGTNTPDTRSASREMGAFFACASSTSRTMRRSVVSSPVRVTRTCSSPDSSTLPPVTALCGPLSTGRLSPVSMLSSTAPVPDSTSPSSGTRAPARISRTSPALTAAVGASCTRPSASTSTHTSGASFLSPSIAPRVRRVLRNSKYLPSITSVMTTAADSKYRSCTRAGSLRMKNSMTVLYKNEQPLPSATSVSMLGLRENSALTPPVKKSRPAISTGTVSTSCSSA